MELSAQVGQLQAREQALTTMIKLKVTQNNDASMWQAPCGRQSIVMYLISLKSHSNPQIGELSILLSFFKILVLEMRETSLK